MATKTRCIDNQNGSEEEEDEMDRSGYNAEEFHVRHMEVRPFRPFKTSEEYLYAMKEDLAEWLTKLYCIVISVDDFLDKLETGVVLCRHANNILNRAREFKITHAGNFSINIPDRDVVFRTDVVPGTFKARDNVSNFISWCRALNIKECLLFETDDLVMRKNERSFILCLLEVARYGAQFGMLAPVLVQIEQEIDAEIEDSEKSDNSPNNENIMTRSFQSQEQRMLQLMGLHDRVVNLLNRCTCPSQFPMIKVADGKYRIGDTKVLIFVRILRNHVMVRVGGGWDTLEHYLDKHDPCRCRSGHRLSTSAKFTMSSVKSGSPNMQVTFNRPSQDENPLRGSSGQFTQYAMEHISEPRKDSPYPLSVSRKLRSKSFDNCSQQVVSNNVHQQTKISYTTRDPPKENTDPSSDRNNGLHSLASVQSLKNHSSVGQQQNTPLLSSCPNKIPLQKFISKSKIPCLDQPLQKTIKSQSIEDLFRTRYYLGADDRWMRSRSSSSSPIHGTPRSTSMEQCNLSAMSKGHHPPGGSLFFRNQPGQYSLRKTKKSPELRRKSLDVANKTWSVHQRIQRSPIHQEWIASNSNSGSPGSISGPQIYSSHTQTKQKHCILPAETELERDLNSSDIFERVKELNGHTENSSRDSNNVNSDSGEPSKNSDIGIGGTGKNCANREGPVGSRIPVLKLKKHT